MSKVTNTTRVEAEYGVGVYVTVCLYIFFLLGVAIVSWWRNRKTEGTMKAHYMGNKSFGPVILTFTFFATTYSGYTVVGVPTDAYKTGWLSLKWMGAILALSFTSAAFHPILRKLSVARQYLSPVDFIHDRYHSKFLCLLVACCMILPSWLYLTAQFTAMGNSIYGLTDQRVPSWVGSSVLGIIILLYETFGGLNSVAWTDVLQGALLVIGFTFLSFTIRADFGSLQSRIDDLTLHRPELLKTPSKKQIFSFFSFVHLWMSFPLYPHVLQRIYAAKSTTTLRITLTLLSFSSFLTMIPGIFLGIYGASVLPTNDPSVDGKAFFGEIMQYILSENTWNAFVVTIVLTSSLAAIMSTADSALIALSNVISVDIAKGWLVPSWTEEKLLKLGKVSSIFSAALCLAISIGELDLSELAVLQNSILIQCVPGFIMGFHWPGMKALPVTIGILCGLVILIILNFGFGSKELYFAPGVWALWLNWVVVIVLQLSFSQLPLQEIHDDKKNSTQLKPNVDSNDVSWERFGSVPLTHNVIKEYMSQIRQPISCWPVFLLSGLSLLFFVPLFSAPDSKVSLSSGVPEWAIGSITSLVIGCLCCGFLFSYWWRTPKEEELVKNSDGLGKSKAEEVNLQTSI